MKTGLHLAALCALLAAACGPSQSDASSDPTPEEMGMDDPGAPMEPAPDPRPMVFEAMSRTAEAFTGAVTLTAQPRLSPNAPPAMKITAANGLTYLAELLPGAAEQASVVDWKALFGQDVATSGDTPPGGPSIDIHSVVREDVPAAAVNGGYCGADAPTSFIAMATGLDSGDQKFMSIAAFRGNVWPPAADALCGTFNYIPPAPPL